MIGLIIIKSCLYDLNYIIAALNILICVENILGKKLVNLNLYIQVMLF